ncbi:helix-turn-helix domain-containing protein [Sphingorhabdus buctiana]|uniref:Helix-turn-helix domain-containing protein n=1 Tax=Sphingorhabdus buctiana TaxID=1508805 RepID=A0ABW4MF35_9SPHN
MQNDQSLIEYQSDTRNCCTILCGTSQFSATDLPGWVHEPAQAVQRRKLTVLDQSEGLLTVDDIAAYLRVSTKTVRRQIAAGHISAIRIGRLIRVSAEELMRLTGIKYNRVISNK